MKLSKDILTSETKIFDGLFGVFDDALPDGWGRLLLDRSLIQKGINIKQITPLDRLAFVGETGMGALNFKPHKTLDLKTSNVLNLDEISNEVTQVLEGSSSEMIDRLYQMAGSSGGARPKILVGYNPKNELLNYGKPQIDKQLEPWILKFPSQADLLDIANIEFAYYQMAVDAGVFMSESKLFKTDKGNYYFGSKRFDRYHGNRYHMHSVSGLLHDNFRYSNLDYGHIMDAAFRLERRVDAYERILRLAAFNVYSHNRDDHSKNFSFLMNSKGNWTLAPAYDLTFSSASHGLHSTMIGGESQNPGREHLMKLADNFDIKNAKDIIDEVQTVIANWATYAEDCGVTRRTKKMILKVISNLRD